MSFEETSSTIKVSVIIPVWNPGPGISRCIESLRKQTLKEIEMIFVDDCGTDDSMDKVRAAAAEDKRIRIIYNEENIGAGSSRNKGIEEARGEYLSFVDADDYVASNFLELLYTESSTYSLDIAKGSKISVNDNGEIYIKDERINKALPIGLKRGKPLYLTFLYEHFTAIYRRETILSKNARYGTSIRGEDTLFLLQICSQTESFSIVSEAYYYYCERSDGAINTINPVLMQGCLQSIAEKVDYVQSSLPDSIWSREYIERWLLFYIKEGTRYREIADLKSELADYTEKLRSEFMRLPYYADLAKASFSLYVLQEYAELLPKEPFAPPWKSPNPPIQYAELAGQWVDYYLNNKDAQHYLKDFIMVFIRARMAVQGKPATTYSKEERREGKRILQDQMKRLPPRIRFSLPTLTLAARIAMSLPRSAYEDIKELLKRL